MRRQLRVRRRRPGLASGGVARRAGPVQPGAPGRAGRRSAHRRRRRHPDPDTRPLPARRRRPRAAPGRPVRHRHRLPAPRPGRGRTGRRPRRGHHPRRGPAPDRLAGGPHRAVDAGPGLAGGYAELPSDLHRRRRPVGHRPRPAGLHRPQAHRARGRAGRRRLPGRRGRGGGHGRGRAAPHRRVLRQPQRPDRRLQGDADVAPAHLVLPGPARRAGGERAGAGPLPLLHQHLPVVASGPPLPDDRPQRRDQHHQRQPQLDAGPGGAAVVAAPRRPGAGPADLHPRRQRHRRLRRGARTAHPQRLLDGRGRADDDPRAVGAPRRDGPRAQGLLPVPRHPHGALGRPPPPSPSPTAR